MKITLSFCYSRLISAIIHFTSLPLYPRLPSIQIPQVCSTHLCMNLFIFDALPVAHCENFRGDKIKSFGMKYFWLLLFFFSAAAVWAQAPPLRLAVAANAQFVIKALQADFTKKTGIQTEAVSGSSGKLTAQIKNGAPYDLFLSADMEFPESLYKEGFGITAPREYASGSLIVCSISIPDTKNWQTLLAQESTQKIALANPALAPYGKAAEQALRHYGLWDKIATKLVYGESISQVNTYITTGAVTMGFTTESLIYEYPEKEKLHWTRIDPKLYEKIRQGFVVLRHAREDKQEKAAMQFYKYLSSPAAKKILQSTGYKTP